MEDGRKDKLNGLNEILKANGFEFEKVLNVSYKDAEELLSGDKNLSKAQAAKLSALFANVSVKDILDEVSPLPDAPRLKLLIPKLRQLNKFLTEEKGITLARAISAREEYTEDVLDGGKTPSKRVLSKIAAYFFLTVKDLTNDGISLPEGLQVDDDLCSIQRKDVENTLQMRKHKNYIKRNFNVLSFSHRLKLLFSLLIVAVPLIVFTGYCSYLTINEKAETLAKYERGSDVSEIYDKFDAKQTSYYNKLLATSKENDPDAYYCNVIVGTELYSISGISAATSSYKAKMDVYFIFDKDEFNTMFARYAERTLLNKAISDWEEETGGKMTETSMSAWKEAHEEYFGDWVSLHAREFYPGETSSNVLVDKNSMFDVGNGSIAADSLSYVKDLEEIESTDESGKKTVTCYQKVTFDGEFHKAFDSHRYPLDSVQFKMYIKPTMDSEYIRYIPDRSQNAYKEYVSGFSPYFFISNGYRLLKEKDNIKNYTLRVNYYQDVNNDPAVAEYAHTYRTQLEIVVRANRAGISLFLQAFINLFSVVIWIIIAFYNQSYNNEDSIGMLGTGLFGVISSILVGLSMISDAGIFSIITMLNIFTLAVIMIMTYQSIAAKRANIRQDKVQIAYNGIKLRVMFIILIICTLMMFFGLPLMSYLFGF